MNSIQFNVRSVGCHYTQRPGALYNIKQHYCAILHENMQHFHDLTLTFSRCTSFAHH